MAGSSLRDTFMQFTPQVRSQASLKGPTSSSGRLRQPPYFAYLETDSTPQLSKGRGDLLLPRWLSLLAKVRLSIGWETKSVADSPLQCGVRHARARGR